MPRLVPCALYHGQSAASRQAVVATRISVEGVCVEHNYFSYIYRVTTGQKSTQRHIEAHVQMVLYSCDASEYCDPMEKMNKRFDEKCAMPYRLKIWIQKTIFSSREEN